MKIALKVLTLVMCFTISTIPALAVINESTRLYGENRYQTARNIANEYNSGLVNCVVLVPGTNFANALPASVLAHKKNAPMLLVDSTASSTKEAFDYIVSHLTKIGTIYLIGDKNLLGSDFESKLNLLGYKNIIRISGVDKYETDYLIAEELNVSPGTPLVISSGENFPDALAISSFAAAYGWPVLLTNKDAMIQKVKEYIEQRQPSLVYITGGTTVIPSTMENTILSLAPNTKIERFDGNDRYQTAVKIARRFAPGPLHIYIASGQNFPDALAGSVLAAKNEGPILLVNSLSKTSLPADVKSYLQSIKELKSNISLTFLGGTIVIPTQLEQLVSQEGGLITDSRALAEDEVIAQVNSARTSSGLPPLQKNDVLSKLARLKSQDMIDKDYFDHESPTYGSPFDMMDAFGVNYSFAGENIACGQTDAKMVMEAWMNSPGHKANILKKEFTEIGVGLAWDQDGYPYWTQMFIRP